MYTEQITQRLAIGNGIAPQVINNQTVNTDAVDMKFSRRAFFHVSVGAVVNGGSLTCTLQESTDNVTFTNLAGTSVSQSGINAANKITTFEVRAGQLTKRYVRLQVQETGVQNVNVAVAVWGDEGNHKPNNANNGANVQTQNVVS
jgi:hypothetical protein